MQRGEPPRLGKPFILSADDRCLVNTLPVELLSRIFVLGAEHDDFFVNPYAIHLDWELCITQVCRLWRGVAIRTAVLWNEILFKGDKPPTKQLTYLERSRGAPLEIHIYIANFRKPGEAKAGPRPAQDSLATIQPIFAAIIPHVARWRSFEMEVTDFALMKHALEKFCECPSAPLLKRFKLYHSEPDDSIDTALQVSKLDPVRASERSLFSGNFPMLKTVVFNSVPLLWSKFHFPSHLASLELAYHADILRPSYAEFSRMLSCASQLSALTLLESGPAGRPDDWGVTPIELPHLKTLRLKHLDSAYAKSLVSRMNIPRLESLELEFEVQSGDSLLLAMSAPHPLMGHSVFSKLTSLQISDGEYESANIRTAYDAMTNLTSLKLNLDLIDDDWYRILMEQPIPCPSLNSLEVCQVGGHHLRQMVLARIQNGLPLSRLLVDTGNASITEDDENWLRQHVKHFNYCHALIVNGKVYGKPDSYDSDDEVDEDEDD